MGDITVCELPPDALLQTFAGMQGCYTDCFTVRVEAPVSLADYVGAFYTTPLFRLERFILKWSVARPSKDEDVHNLTSGAANRFAAWDVEARDDRQLLMCDMTGRTRSWFMVMSEAHGTRLYFGSAVTPAEKRATGAKGIGWLFSALIGFHKLYSRALLWSAKQKLKR